MPSKRPTNLAAAITTSRVRSVDTLFPVKLFRVR